MLQTPHAIVGATIVSKVVNPYLGISLSLLSHFVLDKTPHWNPQINTKRNRPDNKTLLFIVVDILLALTVGLYMASTFLPDTRLAFLITLGAFAGVFPDVTKYPYFMFKKLRKGLYRKWVAFEKSLQVDVPIIPGIATQVIISILSLWWFFAL